MSYPADYPLWRDINFTPDWVYQRIQKRSLVGHVMLPPPAYSEYAMPSKSLWPADKAWNDEEDALVIYAQSNDGKREGLTYKNVAAALGRTVGAVKSRWFREIKPWRESEPAPVVNKKIQEGKRLAFEKYKCDNFKHVYRFFFVHQD